MSDHDKARTWKEPVLRSLTCTGCGEAFICSLAGDCWCDAEEVRVPLPATGDCLCRNCLRKLAVR